MRLLSVPGIRRNFNRAREIITVLSKYGLAEWVYRIGPSFAKDFLKNYEGTAIARQPWEVRLRMAMTEIGPTTIKLGQFLSTRPDLVGLRLATELQKLQGDVAAEPYSVVRQTITATLGQTPEELFDEFEERPMASGSIGQVHRARLKPGIALGQSRNVVVKVRHPDIQHKVQVDLDILVALAQLMEGMPEFANYNPTAVVKEFRRQFMHELDFRREARYMQRMARDHSKNTSIRIPAVFDKYSGADVLTMERLDGIPVSNRAKLIESGADLRELARRGADIYMQMIFEHGFYHADPHPGNILVMRNNVIGLLDFGNVGQLDEQSQDDIEEVLLSIATLDASQLTSTITRIGEIPSDLNRSDLSIDIEDFISFHGMQSIDEFDVSGALNEMADIIRRYQIHLPPRMTMLLKVLVTLEGTARQLSPQFSLLEVMRPYRAKMIRRRLSPRRNLRKLRRVMGDVERAVGVLPEAIIELIYRVRSGRFTIHLDHQGLEPSVNRLVLGLMVSSLFLGSSWMISAEVAPVITDLPFLRWVPLVQELSLPGFAGVMTATLAGMRLIRAINKSGRLD